jgi:hypothetical protein
MIALAILLVTSPAYAEPPAPGPALRSRDEMGILYFSAFGWGMGTGGWFALETRPRDILPASLPFAGFTAASVSAVALADTVRPFHRGEAQAISAGLFVGFGEGVWISGFQNARENRLGAQPWGAESVATVLWASSTIGAATGVLVGLGAHPTPGRSSFVESTAIWSGVVAGLAAGAIIPDDPHRLEQAFVISGVAYNAGLAGGVLLAPLAAPSIWRVRIADLSGIGGALTMLGVYAATTEHGFDSRVAAGLTAVGATGGLVTSWLLTSRMSSDPPKREAITIHPTMVPIPNGAGLGVSGSM